MTPAEPEHNGKDGRDMLYETIAFPDNAPLQCSIVEVEEYPFHMHDDVLEIMFALEGSFELTVVNNVLDMKAGDIYVSCPRELHRLCAYPHTRGTVMLLHINVEAYRAEFPDLRTYQFANSALENNTAGIQMLGSYLKKQLPRLLGGWVFALFGLAASGLIGSLITSTVGAILVLWIASLFSKSK